MMRSVIIIASVPMLAGCTGNGLAELEVRPVAPEGYGASRTGAGDLYNQGKQQLADGNAGLAIDAFRRALRADPNSVDTLNGLAVAYDRIGRFDLSRRYYEQALGIEPNSAMVLHNLGYSLALQGRHDEGRELMVRAAGANDPVVTPKARQHLAEFDSSRSHASNAMSPSATMQAAQRWIERTTALVQTLVTKVAVDAGPASIEPRLRKVSVVDDNAADTRAVSTAALPSVGEAVSAMTALPEEPAPTKANGPGISVQVVNAVGRSRMATRFGEYLAAQGVAVVGFRNGARWDLPSSTILYNQANRQAAISVAQLLPFEVALRPIDTPFAGVQLILGHNALRFDNKLIQQHREARDADQGLG